MRRVWNWLTLVETNFKGFQKLCWIVFERCWYMFRYVCEIVWHLPQTLLKQVWDMCETMVETCLRNVLELFWYALRPVLNIVWNLLMFGWNVLKLVGTCLKCFEINWNCCGVGDPVETILKRFETFAELCLKLFEMCWTCLTCSETCVKTVLECETSLKRVETHLKHCLELDANFEIYLRHVWNIIVTVSKPFG